MASFPNLSTGKPLCYPVTRGRRRRCTTITFNDFSEQKFAMGTVLDDLAITFNSISTADKDTVRAFWNSMHGSYDTTWDITATDVDSSTISIQHLQFTPGQQFAATQIKPGRWSLTLNARRTRKT